jgi:cytochrome b561
MSMTDISGAGSSAAAPAGDEGLHARPLPVARIFHWVTAILVAAMFASGVLMTQIGYTPIGNVIFSAHKLTGACLLVLVLARLAYRVFARLRGRWLPRIGNHAVHRLIYAACILVPLLGWAGVSDFGARETLFGIVLPKIWPEGAGYDHWLFTAHAWLAFGLISVVVVHIAVALRDYAMRGSAGRQQPDSGKDR